MGRAKGDGAGVGPGIRSAAVHPIHVIACGHRVEMTAGSCTRDFPAHAPGAWSQAGLPATASMGARAFAFTPIVFTPIVFTLGVRALLRMSVFTYFVE